MAATVKADGSKHFKLKGGKHDGMTVRLYPSLPEGAAPSESQTPGWERFVYEGQIYAPNGRETAKFAEMSFIGDIEAAA